MVSMEAGATLMAIYTCPKCHGVTSNPSDAANMYCRRCNAYAADLRDEIVHDFDHMLGPDSKYRNGLTRRDCFSLAILCLTENRHIEEARLVHGLVRDSWNPGRYVVHAWCEFPAEAEWSDGRKTREICVVDYTQLDEHSRVRPRDQIYAAMGVSMVKRYAFAEALREALLNNSDGPWPSSPGGRNQA